MTQLVFTLFGAFNVLANGESVTGFRTDKERALLTYLALEAERPVSRSTLMNLFWSAMRETRARDNLRKTLHRLRHTLDAAVPNAATSNTVIPGSEQLLTITRQTIQFNQANAFVDVQAFQALLAASNTHDHTQLHQCVTCLAQLEEATALYKSEIRCPDLRSRSLVL